jgi:hypothetical protein
MDSDTGAVVAAASALTGMIRALELHADVNPDQAVRLREDADDLRATRDHLLATVGLTPSQAAQSSVEHEWSATAWMLTQGNAGWSMEPSRDPWAARS